MSQMKTAGCYCTRTVELQSEDEAEQYEDRDYGMIAV